MVRQTADYASRPWLCDPSKCLLLATIMLDHQNSPELLLDSSRRHVESQTAWLHQDFFCHGGDLRLDTLQYPLPCLSLQFTILQLHPFGP